MDCVRQWTSNKEFADNEYSSKEFAEIMREYQCWHITSSPLYPQSNGEAERAVKTTKGLLKKEGDPHMALLPN